MHFRKTIFFVSTCLLLACCPAAQAAYIDNGDGTVTDDGTGLMWQQGLVSDNYTWEQALAYCDNLTLAGYTDWRLPTAKELASLVDSTRFSPAINTAYFTTIPGAYYWSSTTDIYKTFFAWYIYSATGYLAYGDKTDLCSVRAVRAGQAGSFANLALWPVPDTGQTLCYDNAIETVCPSSGEAFYGQDAGYSINPPVYTKLADVCSALPDNAITWAMVRDEVTGLIWEEKHFMDTVENYADPNDADNTYTWYDNDSARNGGNAGTPNDPDDTMHFIQDINTAAYGGFADWRIPTEKELQTIVDYGQKYPSINILYFTNSLAALYWSSTSSAAAAVNAWSVYFNLGFVSFSDKSTHNYVRAVRGGQSGTLGNVFLLKSGTGTGTVTSADGKIDCGSNCTETYTSCATVALTATAASDSTFTGWSGSGCSGTGACLVTITDNMSVTANFDLIPVSTTTSAVSSTTTIDVSSTTTTDVSSTTTVAPVSSTTTTDNSSTTTVAPVSSTTTTDVSSTTTVAPVSSTTTTDVSSTTTVAPVSSTTTVSPVSSTTTTDNSSTTTVAPVSSTTTVSPVSSTTTTDNSSSTTTVLPVTTTTVAASSTTTTSDYATTTSIVPATTTTVPPAACLVTFAPNTVEVSGTDTSIDVTATFTKHEISTDPRIGNLVVVVNTSCASYITINSATVISVDNATVTAVLNITVKGDTPSTQCSISLSYGSDVIVPPVTCEASFTITQTAATCLVTKVEPSLLPLFAGYILPKVRGIIITGQNSNWNRTSAVSIEGIRIIVLGRIDPTVIHATIIIPGIWLGFVPGEKAVTVVTGSEVCKGKVTIPAIF